MSLSPTDSGAMEIIVPLHYACAGVAAFCASVALFSVRNPMYRVFALCCACVVGGQIAQAAYYQASDIASAVTAIKWQSGFWLLLIPHFFLLVATYTKQRTVLPWYFALLVIYGVLLAVNISLPSGIRFASPAMAAPIVLPWGEVLNRLTGESTLWGSVSRAGTLVLAAWALYRAWVHFHAGHRRSALLLLAYLVFQVASIAHGRMIDVGALNSFYSAGFAFMFLTLAMSINLLLDLRLRGRELRRSNAELTAANAKLHEARQSIDALAYVDAITGLPNRNRFRETALQKFTAADARAGAVALVLIDLDHFYLVNNALGHDVGNALLREVAQRFQRANKGQSFLANLGGDGFIVMIDAASPSVALADAQSLARDLQASLEPEFAIGAHRLRVSCSVGIAVGPQANETGYDVFKHAEIAMYEAKARGRRAIRVFTGEMFATVDAALRVQKGLRGAVERNEFSLHFQPVQKTDGTLASVEALARWHSPELGDVSPGVFIPAAERSGDIHAVGAWVLDQVLSTIARWQREQEGEGVRVAVNVSPWELIGEGYVERVTAALTRHGVAPQRLIIEVTESALLLDLDECIARLKRLRELGVAVALDDFGVGYSSLNYLHMLPLDTLKIDRSFVGRVGERQGRTLISSIVGMATQLGLQVVAEGVETEEQAAILRELGCNAQQGYLVSPPIAEAALHQFLRSRR